MIFKYIVYDCLDQMSKRHHKKRARPQRPKSEVRYDEIRKRRVKRFRNGIKINEGSKRSKNISKSDPLKKKKAKKSEVIIVDPFKEYFDDINRSINPVHLSDNDSDYEFIAQLTDVSCGSDCDDFNADDFNVDEFIAEQSDTYFDNVCEVDKDLPSKSQSQPKSQPKSDPKTLQDLKILYDKFIEEDNPNDPNLKKFWGAPREMTHEEYAAFRKSDEFQNFVIKEASIDAPKIKVEYQAQEAERLNELNIKKLELEAKEVKRINKIKDERGMRRSEFIYLRTMENMKKCTGKAESDITDCVHNGGSEYENFFNFDDKIACAKKEHATWILPSSFYKNFNKKAFSGLQNEFINLNNEVMKKYNFALEEIRNRFSYFSACMEDTPLAAYFSESGIKCLENIADVFQFVNEKFDDPNVGTSFGSIKLCSSGLKNIIRLCDFYFNAIQTYTEVMDGLRPDVLKLREILNILFLTNFTDPDINSNSLNYLSSSFFKRQVSFGAKEVMHYLEKIRSRKSVKTNDIKHFYVFREYRWRFCRNKKCLVSDFLCLLITQYNELIVFSIEVDGLQHDFYNKNWFNGDYEKAMIHVRDILKQYFLRVMNVHLLRLKYQKPKDTEHFPKKIKEFILKLLASKTYLCENKINPVISDNDECSVIRTLNDKIKKGINHSGLQYFSKRIFTFMEKAYVRQDENPVEEVLERYNHDMHF